MAIERVFLDWSCPGLVVGAEWLLSRYRVGDGFRLDQVTVALPGSRAGRRLLEILVQQAETHDLSLAPPRILTIGALIDQLVAYDSPPADALTRASAWVQALRVLPKKELHELFAQPPGESDVVGWIRLGELLDSLHTELAGEALTFADVAARGPAHEGFNETARWQTLAQLQANYLQGLSEAGRADPQTARLAAMRECRIRPIGDLVLLGVADLNRQQCGLLDQMTGRVTALINAPESLKDRFDAHGRIRTQPWCDQPPLIPDERIEVAEGPGEQADAAVRFVARHSAEVCSEEIVIGVCDAELAPFLARTFGTRGIATRWAEGRKVAASAPALLLRSVADTLAGQGFDDWAALLRHPDLERWLHARLPHLTTSWIEELDAYRAKHLPPQHIGKWLGRAVETEALRAACDQVQVLLQPLRNSSSALAIHSQAIMNLLLTVYDQPLDREQPADRALLAQLDELQAIARSMAELPPGLLPAVSGSEALRLLLYHLGEAAVPPESAQDAVEMVGWLELPLDDAAVAVVTGFNEGMVPQSVNNDAFLPNRLRSHLGLVDNERRLARDAYATAVVLHSRPHAYWTAGRWNADGDALTPSRLLFGGDGLTVARRVQSFLRPRPRRMPPRVVQRSTAFQVPPPDATPPVDSLWVTAFRDYLACPYRFYLRHIRKLETANDAGEEMEPGAFGELIHRTLEAFAKAPCSATTNAGEIAEFLDRRLDRIALERFGRQKLPTIFAQIEQARQRLFDFARWQADHAAEGWRIVESEWRFRGEELRFGSGDHPVFLHGTIDRIDRNERDGGLLILDYKTSSPELPDNTHRRKGEWIDLQLPLYRLLAATKGYSPNAALAHLYLPKETNGVELLRAEWSPEDLEEAYAKAREVIECIQRGEFGRMNPEPPAFSEAFAWICQDDQYTESAAEEEPDDAEEAA